MYNQSFQQVNDSRDWAEQPLHGEAKPTIFTGYHTSRHSGMREGSACTESSCFGHPTTEPNAVPNTFDFLGHRYSSRYTETSVPDYSEGQPVGHTQRTAASSDPSRQPHSPFPAPLPMGRGYGVPLPTAMSYGAQVPVGISYATPVIDAHPNNNLRSTNTSQHKFSATKSIQGCVRQTDTDAQTPNQRGMRQTEADASQTNDYTPSQGDGTDTPHPTPPSSSARWPRERTFRTVADIQSGLDHPSQIGSMPSGFPSGPFNCNRELLRGMVSAWTVDPFNPRAGFFVYLRPEQINRTKGNIQRLKCNVRDRTASASCNWQVSYEWTVEGWYLVKYGPHSLLCEHNHNLMLTTNEVHSYRPGRGEPTKEQREWACVMHDCGMGISDITRCLNKDKADKQLGGGPLLYQDVRSMFRSSASERRLDASDLIEFLHERQREVGLDCKARTDEADRLSLVFVELIGGQEDWASAGQDNVLLFDPTWGTNMYGLKLSCFVTVSGLGQSVILAFVLLRSESADSFEWAFRCFADVFRCKPTVFITDGCNKISLAFDAVSADHTQPWFGTQHNLCVYHLSQNFFSHIRCLFGKEIAGWKKCIAMFWSIAQKADKGAQDDFDDEWDHLVEFVRKNSSVSTSQEGALKWLAELGQRAYKFVTRFTWEYPTYGIQSSQRSEAINSAIKLWVKPNMRVVELVETIERYNLDSRDRKLVHAHLQARRNCITSASSCALVLSMQEHLTPFAYNLVLEQEKLMNKYQTEECHGPDGDDLFRVNQTVHTNFLARLSSPLAPPRSPTVGCGLVARG